MLSPAVQLGGQSLDLFVSPDFKCLFIPVKRKIGFLDTHPNMNVIDEIIVFTLKHCRQYSRG